LLGERAAVDAELAAAPGGGAGPDGLGTSLCDWHGDLLLLPGSRHARHGRRPAEEHPSLTAEMPPRTGRPAHEGSRRQDTRRRFSPARPAQAEPAANEHR